MRHLRLTLTVGLLGGTDIQDACNDICELANRVGCLVEAKFNNVLLWAKEGSDPNLLVKNYQNENLRRQPMKIAKGW
jgi:hypothetical protein